MVDRITRVVGQIDAWAKRRRFTRVTRNAVVGFLEHNVLNYAGAMAYFTVLSLFQILLLAVVVASYFLGQGEARDFVVEVVSENTPLDPTFVAETIDSIIASRGTMSAISVLFLLWGALGLFSALAAGISVVFDNVPRRDFIKDKLIGLLLMGLAGGLALASLLIGIVTGILQRMADRLLIDLPVGDTAVWLIGLVAPILLIFLAFWVVYKVVPNNRVTWGEVLPGAIAATVLWTALRFGFTWYATRIADYDSAFGPISTGVTLIIFLYFASVIVLAGAEFARARAMDAELTRRAEQAPQRAAAVESPGAAEAPASSVETDGTAADPHVTDAGAIGATVAEESQRTSTDRGVPRALVLVGAAVATVVGVLIGRFTKRGDDDGDQYL